VNVHVDKPHIVIHADDPNDMADKFHGAVTRAGQKQYR
jgi:hypothetical protein